MPLQRGLVRLARSYAIALRNIVKGWPLVYTGTAAMTLDEDDLALAAALLADRREWTATAPVDAFERQFAAWNGSRAAFAFASGRIALRAAVDALGLQPGDEVVLPGYTCVVVPNALGAAGVRPVYADIELDTYGLDKDALRRALTPRTKAVLVHHLYGYVSRDLDAVLEIAKARGLRVIEDCAQAAGAIYQGRHVGNFGDVAIFSGDPSKPFDCVQGGLATANDDELIARLTTVRRVAPMQDEATIANRLANVSLNYALSKDPRRWWNGELVWLRRGDEYFVGIPDAETAGAPPRDAGCRMSAPLARLASNQLGKLDYYNGRRRANAERWDAWCDANRFARPLVLSESTPMCLRYPVLVTPEMKRDIRWAYRSLGVIPGTWFVTHRHPAPGVLPDVPNATRAVEQCINFPTLYFEDRWRPGAPSAG
ncbi:MAG TPA: DegT/DnrJ/EryC1/StrS family aminotransferase [Vicinamibacterales bacterium]|nr:DegT/DnrJ/EryC1/StrS family aminotransferase [Vicinamibacterales bacterium]